MQVIQKIGLGFFALALLFWNLALFNSHHRYDLALLERVVDNVYHREAIWGVSPVEAEFASNFAFIGALNGILDRAQLAQDEAAGLEGWRATKLPEGVAEWDFRLGSWHLAEYRFLLTKASTVVQWGGGAIVLAYGALCCLVLGILFLFLPWGGGLVLGPYHRAWQSRGGAAWLLGTYLIVFYVVLYWFPEYLTNWTLLLDPLSLRLNGGGASQWFLYGFLYCLAMVVMGLRMAVKHMHNVYQLWRTASVVFFQLAFAFLLPELLMGLGNPYMDLKNAYPLDYDFFAPSEMNKLLGQGQSFLGWKVGSMMLVWGIFFSLILVPWFTYLYGKRWYCSWVCGCGGLAETAGDPFRHLSDKGLRAWRVERYLIHGVLVFILFTTIFLLLQYFTGRSQWLFFDADKLKSWYGFFIGAIFSGVVGTGFYPLMGNRVWCRFGCPLAALMGLVQRFKSRFRITSNGSQCISCGNCSTYCEMGIDVRWYAQRGQDIVRASCVGCGICASVCPRGVLRLENGPVETRTERERVLHFGPSGVEYRP